MILNYEYPPLGGGGSNACKYILKEKEFDGGMRILLDTDVSIKLTKINLIEIVASGFYVILTEQVYREQVTAGLKRNLPDAKRMEKLVQEGKITVSKVIGKTSVENSRLGAGEKSVLEEKSRN